MKINKVCSHHISLLFLVLTYSFLLAVQPSVSPSVNSIPPDSVKNQAHFQDTTQKVSKPPVKYDEYDEHDELWLIGSGFLAALFSTLPPWASVIFFGLALASIITSIVILVCMPASGGISFTGKMRNAMKRASSGCMALAVLLLALIAILIAVIILIGEPFLWIGLAVAAIGLVWWLVKFIIKLFKRSRSGK